MARNVVFACGDDKIAPTEGDASDVFDTFLSTWDQQAREIGRLAKMIDHRPWTRINTRMTCTQTGRLQSLKWLLTESHLAALGATDPRDHIYALLLLAGDRKELGIEVDYNIPYQELYTKLAKNYIKRGDLWFLPFCENSPNDQSLPSWVPDWSKTRGLRPFVSHRCRTNGTKVTYKFSLMNQVLGRHRLHLLGVVVDTISWISSVRPLSPIDYFKISRDEILHWVLATYQSLLQCPALKKDATLASSAHMNACWTFLGNNIAVTEEDMRMSEEDQDAALEKALRFVLEDAIPGPKVTNTWSSEAKRRVGSWRHCMMEATNGRLLFYTENGYFGIGERFVEIGDKVVIFSGAPAPTAIREAGRGSSRIVSYVLLPNPMLKEIFNKGYKEEKINIE